MRHSIILLFYNIEGLTVNSVLQLLSGRGWWEFTQKGICQPMMKWSGNRGFLLNRESTRDERETTTFTVYLLQSHSSLLSDLSNSQCTFPWLDSTRICRRHHTIHLGPKVPPTIRNQIDSIILSFIIIIILCNHRSFLYEKEVGWREQEENNICYYYCLHRGQKSPSWYDSIWIKVGSLSL
jgi:hypothetical protein